MNTADLNNTTATITYKIAKGDLPSAYIDITNLKSLLDHPPEKEELPPEVLKTYAQLSVALAEKSGVPKESIDGLKQTLVQASTLEPHPATSSYGDRLYRVSGDLGLQFYQMQALPPNKNSFTPSYVFQ